MRIHFHMETKSCNFLWVQTHSPTKATRRSQNAYPIGFPLRYADSMNNVLLYCVQIPGYVYIVHIGRRHRILMIHRVYIGQCKSQIHYLYIGQCKSQIHYLLMIHRVYILEQWIFIPFCKTCATVIDYV